MEAKAYLRDLRISPRKVSIVLDLIRNKDVATAEYKDGKVTVKGLKVGQRVRQGEVIGYVQTYYGLDEVVSAADGVLVVVSAQQGTEVAKGEIVARIEKL